MVDRLKGRKTLLYLFLAQSHRFCHKHGCGKVHRIERAKNIGCIAGAVESETHSFQCRFDITDDKFRHLQLWVLLRHFTRTVNVHLFIFGFDHGTFMYPCLFQTLGLHDLHLGVADVLHRFEVLDMCGAYLANDHIMRVNKGRDLGNVPLASGTHLNHINLRIFRKIVVNIFHHTPKRIDRPGCGVSVVTAGEQMRHKILDAGLTVACRDTYNRQILHILDLCLRLALKAVEEHLLYEYGDPVGKEDGDEHAVVSPRQREKQSKEQQRRIEALNASCPHQRFVKSAVPRIEHPQIGNDHDKGIVTDVIDQHIDTVGDQKVDKVPPGLGVVKCHTLKLVAVPL